MQQILYFGNLVIIPNSGIIVFIIIIREDIYEFVRLPDGGRISRSKHVVVNIMNL